jgi:hypothetical protein
MDSVSIFFILDGPKLQAQAVLLAASLRYFNKDRYKLLAYVPESGVTDLARITRRAMRACNVEIVPFSVPKIDGRPAFESHYPHGNKILAAALPRASKISVFLDSDIFCCAPLDFESLVKPGEMCAVVSDYLTGAFSIERWDAGYRFFGHETPEQRVKMLRGRRLLSPPYFNAGMIGFREDVESDDSHLGKVWLDTSHRIDWDLGMATERTFLDQFSLPIAAVRSNIKTRLAPNDYNYNIMHRNFDPQIEAKILHYHGFKHLWAWPIGPEVPKILSSEIGEALAARAFQVFKKHYAFPPDFELNFGG